MRYIKLSGLLLLGMILFGSHATMAANNIFSCVNITNNNQRLSCYDTAAQAQMNKRHSRSVVKSSSYTQLKKSSAINIVAKSDVAVSSAALQKTKNSSLNQAQLTAQFGQKVKPQQMIEQVEFIIKSAKLNMRNKWLLTFENGQVWHATESGLRLKVGAKVIIKQGALNSFFLKKKGLNRNIRVKRIK